MSEETRDFLLSVKYAAQILSFLLSMIFGVDVLQR